MLMPDPKDLKAYLMSELETIVEQLVAQQPASDQITLSDMEELVRMAGNTMEAQMMQALVEAHEAERTNQRPSCPECQQPMRNKGKQRRRVVTEVGEIEVQRSYYHCEQCGVGFFPSG
jgi:uncharacterized protein with PIN domain